MTTKATVPATVTWWQMFLLFISENGALGPYLMQWRGADPFTNLKLVRISILAVGGGVVMVVSLAHKIGDEVGFTIGILGFASIVIGLIIGLSNARCLAKTITAFQVIWNSRKLDLLARNEFDDGMIRAIMTPTATYWAEKVLLLESKGTDRLPKGRREKSSHKRKIDMYVSACLSMGLGRETLTHKELVEKVFHFAKSS